MSLERTAFLTAMLGVFVSSAGAIVVCDDPDLHEITAPSEYDAVGYLSTAGGATGSLIDEWFVLTARHAVTSNTTDSHVTFGGSKTFTLDLAGGQQSFELAEAWIQQPIDLAVVRLKQAAPLSGYAINETWNETGREGTLIGYGQSGLPETVTQGGDPDYPRGTKRIGYNRIDYAQQISDTWMLATDFDAGAAGLGVDKEAMIALGDSGGPVFIEVGGQTLLAGVSVSIYDDGDGLWPEYGDSGRHVRVRTYSDWILNNIPAQPADQTGDFNMDGGVSYHDVDLLQERINDASDDLWFDVSQDGTVSGDDMTTLIEDILGTRFGDVDLGGTVDAADLSVLATYWQTSASGWSQADFTGDGTVDASDLSLLASNWQDEPPAAAALPEPTACLLLAACAWPLLRRRR